MTTVEISSPSGHLEVTAEERPDVVVEGAELESRDGTLVVETTSGSVALRCPSGTDLLIGVGSGTVDTKGPLGDVRVTSSSGRVRLDRVRSLDARSASGRVTVARCDGECRIVTGSGAVEVGGAGHLDATLKSGSLVAGPVGGGALTVKSGSARVSIDGPRDLEVRSFSGKVVVELPEGVHPRCEVEVGSATFDCEADAGDDCTIRVQAMSGSVQVVVA
jgi:DUF4097 and DUF4098 domain-containing protein YvlB